jgi:phosphoribosylformimino-5-aminoimidazole carboxamide ribotide isomerase
MQLIPAIDLKAGRCVRLLNGNFAAETVYPVTPSQLLARYRALGARWLHVVDLDGASQGGSTTERPNYSLIAELVAQSGTKLQVGGGLRTSSSVHNMLDRGVARVVLGTAALMDPEAVRGWLKIFGSERIALAFDVRPGADAVPRVTTHGWLAQSTLSLWDAVARFTDAGLEHVLCTDVTRDGALSGPNLALYAEAVQRYPQIAWQASGGIRDARDLHSLQSCSVAAAISGKALLDNLIPVPELAPFLQSA